MILTHDSEDIIARRPPRINYYASGTHGANPVLALQRISLPDLRSLLRRVHRISIQGHDGPPDLAVHPSNGVGTGFSRKALEMLAAEHANRIFEPAASPKTTKRLPRPQTRLPQQSSHPYQTRRPIATREYFPTSSASPFAKIRWVTGINLQSWNSTVSARPSTPLLVLARSQKPGRQPRHPLTNIVFVYGAVTWSWATPTMPPGACPRGIFDRNSRHRRPHLQAMHTVLRMGLPPNLRPASPPVL